MEGHRLPHAARSTMNQMAEGARCCCWTPMRAPSFPVPFVRLQKALEAPLLYPGHHLGRAHQEQDHTRCRHRSPEPCRAARPAPRQHGEALPAQGDLIISTT